MEHAAAMRYFSLLCVCVKENLQMNERTSALLFLAPRFIHRFLFSLGFEPLSLIILQITCFLFVVTMKNVMNQFGFVTVIQPTL